MASGQSSRVKVTRAVESAKPKSVGLRRVGSSVSKAKPTLVPTAAPSDEEANAAILEARHWRNKYKRMEEREKFQQEKQRTIAVLESMVKEITETKRLTSEYDSLKNEIDQLDVALDLFSSMMPALRHLSGRKDELETKLKRFTSALKQFLARIVVVDSKNVKFPATDGDIGQLAATIQSLNVDLANLAEALGLEEMGTIDNQYDVITVVRNLREAVNLILVAMRKMDENNALLKEVEQLKLEEDSLKAHLCLLKKSRKNPLSYP